MRRVRVCFLYRAAHASSGAKIMRVDQLCDMARAHLGDRYDFEKVELPKKGQNRRIRLMLEGLGDAIVIVLKRAYATFGPGHAEVLRRRARAVIVDHVDAGIDPLAFNVADLHLAASWDGLAGIRAVSEGREIRTALLPHHADPRISWRERSADSTLAMGYFGLAGHALLPRALAPRLIVPDYGAGERMPEVIEAMSRCNVHYAVRPAKKVRNSWKPFTKGINAAAAGANVLVHRDVDDAVAALGPDYPYLIEEPTEAGIMDGVARLDRGIGGPDWRRGLEAMSELRARTLPDRLMRDLDGILLSVA